jgi:hypothetical protein
VRRGVIWIAGVNVDREVLSGLANRLVHAGRAELASKLRAAAADEAQTEVALSIGEREAVLAELDEPLEGLEDLRGMLLAERERRRRPTRHGIGKKGSRNR